MADRKYLNSIEEFYRATRPDSIEELCRDLYGLVHPRLGRPERAEGAESDSWRRSLPDLALLLYDFPEYVRQTCEESLALEDELEKHINALKALEDCPELAAFRASPACAVMRENSRGSIRKALDSGLAKDLAGLDTGLMMLEEGKLAEAAASLARQKEALRVFRERLMNEKDTVPGLPPLEVFLEYRLANTKGGSRADVLLRDPDKERWAIIELKQWTEDAMDVQIIEDEDGAKTCRVFVTPYEKDTDHPAVKVRDVYKPALRQELPEGAGIKCVVYLHDQLFDGGRLFLPLSSGISIYDGRGQHNNIMFTRMRCGSMIRQLADFFSAPARP